MTIQTYRRENGATSRSLRVAHAYKLDRPLRICFLVLEVSKDGRPGPSEIVWDMGAELVRLGHEVHFVVPEKPERALDENFKLHFFEVPPMGYRWFLGQLWLARRMADVVSELDVDIVHAAEYLSTAVLATLYPEIPLVLTVPGNIFQRLSVPDGNQSSYLFTETIKWAARKSAQGCDAVIAFTREMKGWWEWTGSPPQRTPIIPYGVDIDTFQPQPQAREQLSLPAKSLMFLYVGRLDTEKGLFDLLAAITQLHQEIDLDAVRFDLVGDGPLRGRLEEAIQENGIGHLVHLHGPMQRDELLYWYAAADALILPSWIEPFGRVILESMACGTPVLSTNTGGPVDLIVEDYTGFFFPPKNSLALSRLLKKVIEFPAVLHPMRANARNYVEHNFSWARVTERIVAEVYEPLIQERMDKEVNK